MTSEANQQSSCNRIHAEDPPNYVKYYCTKCTALKRQGTSYCPFCGIAGHYYVNSAGQKNHGSGRVQIHLKMEAPAQGEANQQSAESLGIGKKISSEEEQFHSSIKVVRNSFDNLKRCRRDRRKMEEALVTKSDEVRELHQRIENMQLIQTPQPFAIRNVYGQREGSPHLEALGIIRIDQGYPVCDVTVRLP